MASSKCGDDAFLTGVLMFDGYREGDVRAPPSCGCSARGGAAGEPPAAPRRPKRFPAVVALDGQYYSIAAAAKGGGREARFEYAVRGYTVEAGEGTAVENVLNSAFARGAAYEAVFATQGGAARRTTVFTTWAQPCAPLTPEAAACLAEHVIGAANLAVLADGTRMIERVASRTLPGLRDAARSACGAAGAVLRDGARAGVAELHVVAALRARVSALCPPSRGRPRIVAAPADEHPVAASVLAAAFSEAAADASLRPFDTHKYFAAATRRERFTRFVAEARRRARAYPSSTPAVDVYLSDTQLVSDVALRKLEEQRAAGDVSSELPLLYARVVLSESGDPTSLGIARAAAWLLEDTRRGFIFVTPSHETHAVRVCAAARGFVAFCDAAADAELSMGIREDSLSEPSTHEDDTIREEARNAARTLFSADPFARLSLGERINSAGRAGTITGRLIRWIIALTLRFEELYPEVVSQPFAAFGQTDAPHVLHALISIEK